MTMKKGSILQDQGGLAKRDGRREEDLVTNSRRVVGALVRGYLDDMKLLPTERAMGLVTLLSGLAIPLGILIGAGPLGGESQVVMGFEGMMWFVNPVGMWVLGLTWQLPDDLFKLIFLYLLASALSALLWGFADAFFRQKKRSGKPS